MYEGSGIYLLETDDGHTYVGQATRLHRRVMYDHLGQLSLKHHKNKHMQAVHNLGSIWYCDQYIECPIDELDELEELILDIIFDDKKNCNKAPKPMTCRGVKKTEEQKKAQSDRMIGRVPHNKGKPMSEEQKKKLSASHMGLVAPNKGKPMSEEQKIKLSASAMGRVTSEETKLKMSVTHKNRWLKIKELES